MNMKYLLTISLCAIQIAFLNAQDDDIYSNVDKESESTSYNVYIGTSSGINNINAVLGGILEVQMGQKVTGIGGLGLGLWGLKTTADLRIYKSYPQSIYYSFGLSYHTGWGSMQIDYTDPDTGGTNSVDINFKPVTTLNLLIGFQWGITRDDRFRINLEGGYAFPLTPKPYKINTASMESDQNLIQSLDLLSPGGIILGMGLTMGF